MYRRAFARLFYSGPVVHGIARKPNIGNNVDSTHFPRIVSAGERVLDQTSHEGVQPIFDQRKRFTSGAYDYAQSV